VKTTEIIYSAALKVLYIWKGGSQPPPIRSITWMMWRQPYCARTPTTQQLIGGEETEGWSQSVYIYMGMIRRPNHWRPNPKSDWHHWVYIYHIHISWGIMQGCLINNFIQLCV